MKITALRGKVLVTDIERGERKIGGIIVCDDNGKLEGIRPRWAKIYSVGDDITDVKVGEWVCVLHGRWTRAMKVKDDQGNDMQVWAVDWPDAVILVSSERPDDETLSDKV